MDLYKEILINILENDAVKITCDNFDRDPMEMVEMVSYRTLQKIKGIIENDTLDDAECFMKIEEIVCLLEDIGSSGGNRHDFG